MFTGIITHLGKIESLETNEKKDLILQVSTSDNVERNLEIGCSIACSGICLTLIQKKKENDRHIFSFQASKETLDKTNMSLWQVGSIINLEFALRMGDELGGHLVSGHVDGTAQITEITQIKESHRFGFKSEANLMRYIAPKGSITINGVSLTVNEVSSEYFNVNLISHTINNTAFQTSKVGDVVNIEIDMLARYLERMLPR